LNRQDANTPKFRTKSNTDGKENRRLRLNSSNLLADYTEPGSRICSFSFLASWRLGGSVVFLVLAFAIAPSVAQEDDAPRTLIPGKGSDLTTARCVTCHDARHITRAKLSRGEWEDNIRNMKERGAPMEPQEIPVILEYLATYYNRDTPAPAPDASASGDGMAGGADPVAKLLIANACVACHTLDKRVVGPSFREVAARFAGDAGAGGKLVKKIREGGAGGWGAVPMPPHPQLTDADLNTMVGWILQQR
jgi:cytochrome c551/c552